MQIPDNFEALNKLFKESDEDAPTDFAEFLGEPIAEIVLRLGRAIKRLARLQGLIDSGQYEAGALDSHYEDFFRTCKKYMSVLKVRKDEFINYIQKIDTGGMPEYLIMENLPGVCAAVTHVIDGEEDEDDDDFDPNQLQPGEE